MKPLYLGKHIIRSKSDQLLEISPEELTAKIKSPEPTVSGLVERLRQTSGILPEQGREIKKQLPYFCISLFAGGIRNIRNLIQTNYLVMDIDNMDTGLSDLRKRIQSDQRVFLCFISPSGKGLKLLFKFREPFVKGGKYVEFYKSFGYEFAVKYDLLEYADLKTCDPTRASFLSYDPEVYYNENASELVTGSEKNNSMEEQYFLQINEKEESFKLTGLQNEHAIEEEKIIPDYKAILQKFKGSVPNKEKDYFVPDVLRKIIPDLVLKCEKERVNVKGVTDIQYGQKIKFTYKSAIAELNIYYGKKGFSVVPGLIRNYDPGLTTLVENMIWSFIHENHEGIPSE